MLRLLAELLIGPLLVGGSTLTARRWGPHLGGVVSAFPAIAGPVLFITASERGALPAAQAANGTLLGLVGLSGFVLAYSWAALRAPWTLSVLAAWGAGAVAAGLAAWLGGGTAFPAGLATALVALFLARQAMPRAGPDPARGAIPSNIPAGMLTTALLVAALSAAAVLAGPLLGGVLAGLPVLASVLAVLTHRREGPGAAISLLRGMLAGMLGFVGFCAVVAWLIVPAGMAAAFAAATSVALGLELLALARSRLLHPSSAVGSQPSLSSSSEGREWA